MSVTEIENPSVFFKKAIDRLMLWLIGTFLTCIGIGITDHFNLTNVQKNQGDKINKLEITVDSHADKLNALVLTPAINNEQIKELKDDVQELKNSVVKQQETQIKIYDMINDLYKHRGR